MSTTVIKRALAKLRSKQADRVMSLIGPMLDQWECLPNDTKAGWREDSRLLCQYLDKINAAIDGEGRDE